MSKLTTKTKRCVIYTRVSTDGQAEVEFNSCEAQEQKIKSYIESQEKFVYQKSYNDEGFNDGNLNRPSLQELFADIQEGRLDTILVYKLDRLTRSLKDFYNLIKFLDQHNISFISITESFDISTPAGRLFLNMMLTFDQYEREIAGERVKGKLLERAKRGLSPAGVSPYGYKRVNKKFSVIKAEGKVVDKIFHTYVETSSLSSVHKMLKFEGIKN